MIIDKKSGKVLSGNSPSITASPKTEEEDTYVVPQQMPTNGVIDVLEAMKEILKSVTWQYGVPDSPKIFKTVQIDDGQYERVIHPNSNIQYTMGFPAVFVHFIDWHYLTSAKRINEGRATLRIRFILNRLNPEDDGFDTEVYHVAQRINQTIQENIDKYECLQERCQLTYIDPMESFDNSLQPCWMTYEIWFRERNIWADRNMTLRYVTFPPFTNHADQDPTIEDINPKGHDNFDHPTTYDEATGYTHSINENP